MTVIPFDKSEDNPWAFQDDRKVPTDISDHGRTLKFKTIGKTDWWRGPSVDSTSGVVYALPKPDLLEGEQTFSVHLDVDCQVRVSSGVQKRQRPREIRDSRTRPRR
jgi:hypothetical protein